MTFKTIKYEPVMVSETPSVFMLSFDNKNNIKDALNLEKQGQIIAKTHSGGFSLVLKNNVRTCPIMGKLDKKSNIHPITR